MLTSSIPNGEMISEAIRAATIQGYNAMASLLEGKGVGGKERKIILTQFMNYVAIQGCLVRHGGRA
jgi:hypothetical protein